MIRYDVQLKTYLSHDFNDTNNTAGRLLLGGTFAVVNTPNTTSIYIFNYLTNTGTTIVPVVVTAAIYMLEVNTKGN